MDARYYQLLNDCHRKLCNALTRVKLKGGKLSDQVQPPIIIDSLTNPRVTTILIHDLIMIHYKGGSPPWQIDTIDPPSPGQEHPNDNASDYIRHIHHHGNYESSDTAINAAITIIKNKL